MKLCRLHLIVYVLHHKFVIYYYLTELCFALILFFMSVMNGMWYWNCENVVYEYVQRQNVTALFDVAPVLNLYINGVISRSLLYKVICNHIKKLLTLPVINTPQILK
jgi:hypothetical protein